MIPGAKAAPVRTVQANEQAFQKLLQPGLQSIVACISRAGEIGLPSQTRAGFTIPQYPVPSFLVQRALRSRSKPRRLSRHGSLESGRPGFVHNRYGWVLHMPSRLLSRMPPGGISTREDVMTAGWIRGTRLFFLETRGPGYLAPRAETSQPVTRARADATRRMAPPSRASPTVPPRDARVVNCGLLQASNWREACRFFISLFPSPFEGHVAWPLISPAARSDRALDRGIGRLEGRR